MNPRYTNPFQAPASAPDVELQVQEAEVLPPPADALDLAVRLYRDMAMRACILDAAMRSLERLQYAPIGEAQEIRRLH